MWIVPWTAPSPPPDPAACELLLYHHEADEGNAWSFRLTLSQPDAAGRSRIERVALGAPTHEVPPDAPVAPLYEVDLLQRFLGPDGELVRVADASVAWGPWPLDFSFVGPDPRDPAALALYHLHTRPTATPADWGSCILQLDGPTADACTVVREVRGDCLARWERRTVTRRSGPAPSR